MAGLALRPTPDRLREALFNVLAPRIEGVTFLDAYAGSGSVGIEALSRGAARAVFIEKHFGVVGHLAAYVAEVDVADPISPRVSIDRGVDITGKALDAPPPGGARPVQPGHGGSNGSQARIDCAARRQAIHSP